MNLRLKGEKVISRLLGRRKKSSVQLAGKFYPSSGQHNPFMYGNLDRENDGTTTAAPKIVVQDESSKATENPWNTAGVRNARDDVLNTDAQSKANRVLRSETPDIVTSEHEGEFDKILLLRALINCLLRHSAFDVDMNKSSGFFNHAHHLVFNNPTMVDKYTNIVNQVVGDREAKAKELLSRHIIPGAAHDSSARDPPPQCHPGTRIKINERIMAWFYDERKRELILWIYGPAGVGKSAIVQTIAEALAISKCLGASVFFSRPNGRNNSRSVFITIAYQLAVHIEPYCAFISDKLASDPELVNKGMKEQFRAFIVEPFVQAKIGSGGKTWSILLDGLDELDEQRWQREIIRLVTTFVLEYPEVPLVWVISSRPEPHISNTFKQKQTISSYWEEYVPVDSPEACQDVERYLRSSFETIRQDFPHIIPKDWPDEMKIVTFAYAASGLFAFADVAVRFIGDPRHADPVTRLEDVLSVIDGSGVSSVDDQPFAHLDAMYTRILTSIPSKTWPTTQRLLGTIFVFYGTLASAKALSVTLSLELSKIYSSMNDLYSVLDIPLDDVYSQLVFHHASFVEFLEDDTRSKEFYISSEDAWRQINKYCLELWLDFKRQFPQGSSSGYKDRWSKFASRFHSSSDASISVDTTSKFDAALLYYIHGSLLDSLSEMYSAVQAEASQEDNEEQLFDLMRRVDAAVACHGVIYQRIFVCLWFDVWKTYQAELMNRGIACEIRLGHLQSDRLEWPREHPTHTWEKSSSTQSGSETYKEMPSSPESFNEYMSGLKYLQQRNPTVRVLISGTPGNRFAVFIYEYTEDDDYKEYSLHLRNQSPKFDEYDYHGYYCIPYPDDTSII
ncbi:hypothetical protein AGABI2DRAFT_119611 [Agaricus bisporus var. bisporus H97]|uniref:hypothetical protein n=1 Tax=Agaricus bisporus var. bisporus (strain H97 / ATCC MYA-4626 / FGSC 10389) TaxID=936046 RepID=UPI00029F4FA1|nr:hypothetical protein AGABI2DRAFT_119611 [Agaricus bisporus var. bisporus H97]EKV45949.1 hypothetical protein AGABI2DRAFT_119611 [Agaricus bisporus var. bisporus H97]